MERTWKHTLFACIAAAVLVATLLLVGGKLIEKTSDTPAGTQQTEENTQQQEQTGSEMPSADPNDPSIIGGNTVTTDVGQQDRYQTDPVPEGRPDPVEPDEADIDDGITYTCTFSISCETILDNWELCDESKKPLVPSDGVILSSTIVSFSEGESVFDVLQRICKDNKIHMESSWTPMYNSAYIEGINNLYEFDVEKAQVGCIPSTAGTPTTAVLVINYRTETLWRGAILVTMVQMWAAATPPEADSTKKPRMSFCVHPWLFDFFYIPVDLRTVVW